MMKEPVRPIFTLTNAETSVHTQQELLLKDYNKFLILWNHFVMFLRFLPGSAYLYDRRLIGEENEIAL